MNRLAQLVRALRRIRPTVLVPLVTLGIGIVLGVIGTHALSNSSPTASTKTSASRSVAGAETTSNLDKNYNRALGMVDKDLASGRLSDNQAKQLRGQLESAYKLLQSTSPDDARELLKTKRTEWRTWATEHQVSNRYFMALY